MKLLYHISDVFYAALCHTWEGSWKKKERQAVQWLIMPKVDTFTTEHLLHTAQVFMAPVSVQAKTMNNIHPRVD